MFRPPMNRSMRTLDRALFDKKVLLAAARISDPSLIQSLRTSLREEILQQERLTSIRPDPEDPKHKRLLLLNPSVRYNEPETWSSTLRKFVATRQVEISAFDLHIQYDYWTYHDIITSILSEEDQDEVPVGFTMVGHVAHVNLREQYLPYKSLIAQVLMDKNPAIRTVINKVESVGVSNEFRTFQYELLAGDPSLEVEVREQGCIFRFDYSKVYWNSRLGTEHERLVRLFKPWEAVCDVMAGVGPFAIPAGKKGCWVWANDLNPHSYAALEVGVSLNKVGAYVHAFNLDGRQFIRSATQELINRNGEHRELPSRRTRTLSKKPKPQERTEPAPLPLTFQHFVMNLPASAITFLDAFIGLYTGHEDIFKADGGRKLPLVHAYCFGEKTEDLPEESVKICRHLSQVLQHEMTPGQVENGGVEVHDVRAVAPNKSMFCASFRLPEEVAFKRS